MSAANQAALRDTVEGRLACRGMKTPKMKLKTGGHEAARQTWEG
jgi:hypothetical protein